MAVPGTNLDYGNASRAWSMFFRKLGIKARELVAKNPTKRNNATDDGTTAPRPIGICVKYSATAPTTDASGDEPTGVGDICIHVTQNTPISNKIVVSAIDIYLCTAYVSDTSFTWTKIVD